MPIRNAETINKKNIIIARNLENEVTVVNAGLNFDILDYILSIPKLSLIVKL